jgi:hypothetical protein
LLLIREFSIFGEDNVFNSVIQGLFDYRAMAEQLSLKQLSQYTFASDERLAKMESGTELDEEPTEFTAFYHRDRGGVEEDVLVRDVNEIIEESKWGPLLDKGFERIAYLLEGANTIPVGEKGNGDLYELTYGNGEPAVGDKVQIQLRQE